MVESQMRKSRAVPLNTNVSNGLCPPLGCSDRLSAGSLLFICSPEIFCLPGGILSCHIVCAMGERYKRVLRVRVEVLMERENGPSQVAFVGRFLSVRVDPVIAKSGPGLREVVVRPPAVAVIAETGDGRLVVIRQFRWAVGELLYELPAGLMDGDETPQAAARRELAEETGYHADEWHSLADCFTSPGFSTERIYLYHARQLSLGVAHGDPDEEIAVEHWTRDRASHEISHGGVKNGVLLIGLLWWLSHAV